ncbi:MAG: hypothetical protein ACM3SY_01110 [Candidatus Omnitrophota bacterium]
MARIVKIVFFFIFLFTGISCLVQGEANPSDPEITPLKYNYYYVFKGDAKGTILLIFHYRVYYEASASIQLIAERQNDNTYQFNYDTAKNAYVARTLGFGGRSMCVMNADYDIHHNLTFAREIENYLKTIPYYSKYITSSGIYPYEITTKDKTAVTFTRDPGGKTRDIICDLKLVPKFKDDKFDTYFHVDKIMQETLRCFNHSFLPPGKELQELLSYLNKEWWSAPIDFSAIMNEISRLISTFTEKYVRLQQESPIRIKYRIASADNAMIHVLGETYPNIGIWQDWRIKKVVRNIKLRPSDFLLLEDEVIADIRNKKGNGGFLHAYLKKL